MSLFQWIGSNNADLGNGANWFDTSEPGMGQPPGVNDVAIIQSGQGLNGTLSVAGLDIVSDSSKTSISITGSSTQVTAASVGIGLGFTLDTGAFLQAGTLGIDGDGTVVTVQNNAILYDHTGEDDVLTIGASAGNASVLLTKGGAMVYYPSSENGTLSLGGVSNSQATMTISAGGIFEAYLSSVSIGATAGSTGILNVTGAGSQILIDNSGNTFIGDFGQLVGSAQGTVQVTGGAYASLNSLGGVYIGTIDGMAKVLVSGANSDIEAGPSIEIGQNGDNIAGEILVQTGGEFDASTDTTLTNGTISVTGTNSLYTGRILEAYGGTNVQAGTGGLIHVADLELYGKLTLTAGTVNARADLITYGGSEIVGAGTITAGSIANAGLLDASGGTLVVTGSITGTGTAEIQSGAKMQLASAVSGQAITFESGANTLSLGDAAGFGGRVLDFATGDAIDLLGSVANTLSFSGGALIVDEGTTRIAKIFMNGSYKTANFKLTSDQHGGTLISYVASSSVREPLPISELFHTMALLTHTF